jgi:myo-inositol-1(or 4)-monophosphatase
VSEAGGKISKMDGSEYSIYDKEILVSNGLLHDQMIKEMIQ